MENIYDWCISRQLWWGHRIPAWYCESCNNMIVSRTDPSECTRCGSHQLRQETDVLDTWFSSALLPFTSLGWPEATRDLKVFYPSTLLITGFDIIFFWMARMIMMGCHFMAPPHRPCLPGEGRMSGDAVLRESVPFREVYIHALVRDAERQKISKTKGNVIDPIEITEKYGTDAVRFTLASQASPGTDIAFNESRTDGYRAFANKIWNAARFVFMNLDRVGGSLIGEENPPRRHPSASGTRLEDRLHTEELGQSKQDRAAQVRSSVSDRLEDRWIKSRFNRVAGEVNQALEAYRFDEAANTVYRFFWGEFCDWYLEIIKPRLSGPEDDARPALAFLGAVFEGALRLLSPFMPFITEEIWHTVYEGKPPRKSIALARYPELEKKWLNDQAEEQMAVLQDLIRVVRDLRGEIKEIKANPRLKTPIRIHAGAEVQALVRDNSGMVERLTNVEGVEFVNTSLAQAAGARATSKFEVVLVYEQKVDAAAERERLQKELTKLEAQLANAQRQLGNEQFLAKAPAKVVEGLRKQESEVTALIAKIKAARDKMG
jgi:valyl-tRNA synthetase